MSQLLHNQQAGYSQKIQQCTDSSKLVNEGGLVSTCLRIDVNLTERQNAARYISMDKRQSGFTSAELGNGIHVDDAAIASEIYRRNSSSAVLRKLTGFVCVDI